jgi:serine/threonine-protein kinase RsbW
LTFPQGQGKLPNPPIGGFFSTRGANARSGQPGLADVSGLRAGSQTLAMTELRVSYTLDSTLETVDNAEQAASRIATETGFDEDEVMQISMAVREAAVNAVLHGNAYDPGKKVKLDFERTGSDLVITIRDQGKGLDLDKIPDPLAPENLLKTSGRGIFLIRSFMDEVQIHPSQTGTEIKLVKHVHGPSGDAKEASQ